MKILVVEDEPSLREGLADLLRGEGFLVETVEDGETALERGSDPAVELLVLDLMLPRLDGLEVCRRLRELRPELPVLMLTARGSEDDKVSGLRGRRRRLRHQAVQHPRVAGPREGAGASQAGAQRGRRRRSRPMAAASISGSAGPFAMGATRFPSPPGRWPSCAGCTSTERAR